MDRLSISVGRLIKLMAPTKYFVKVPLVGCFMPLVFSPFRPFVCFQMQTVTLALSLLVLGLVGEGVLGSSSSEEEVLKPCYLQLSNNTVVFNNASVCTSSSEDCMQYSTSVSLPSGILALSVCIPKVRRISEVTNAILGEKGESLLGW